METAQADKVLVPGGAWTANSPMAVCVPERTTAGGAERPFRPSSPALGRAPVISCGLMPSLTATRRTVFRSALLLVACLAPAALPPLARAMPEWRARYAATGRLCQDPRNGRACLDSLIALRAEIPGHPSILSATAHTAMRLGETAAAVHALEVYVAMGMQRDLLGDSLFVPLHDTPEFETIVKTMEANTAARVRSREIHRFHDPDLMPEAIAWDARKKIWLIGSIHRRSIMAIDARGAERVVFSAGRTPRWGVFALAVDAKRRLLWASTAATAEMEGGAGRDSGRAALQCFDLDHGSLLRTLALPADSNAHVLGDLAIAADGTVYVTDSVSGGVYRAKPGAEGLETLLPSGSFVSPQTPVPLIDGRHLLVPDYARGIASLDLEQRTITWLGQPPDLASVGIDGLYAWQGRLIAIQNGVEPHRVVELSLDPGAGSIVHWRVLEQKSPSLGEPNHGVIVGDVLTLIGNSGWDRVGEDGALKPAGAGQGPVLLRLPLSKGL